MSFAEAQPNFTFGVIFSEPKERSSEAGSALNFWLLFLQGKSKEATIRKYNGRRKLADHSAQTAVYQ